MSLSDEERSELKEILLGLREESEAQVIQLEKLSRPVSLDDPIGRLSRADALQRQEMSKGGLNREKARLARIKDALQRIDQPDFGECARCHKPIGMNRLRFFPETVACVSCAG